MTTAALLQQAGITRDILRAEVGRELARRSLTAYSRHIYANYMHAAHLDKLDALLMQISRYAETGGAEGVGRAIIEMPPRMGKTVKTSRLFPSWHLGRNPDHRLMLVSYAALLAEKNSRWIRNMIRSERYQELFGIGLAADSAAVDSWNLAGHEGGCDALGITGGAAGKGSHLLIIDDPIMNRAQAESALIRDRVWDAFTDDLYTRLEPGGAIVVMMTRWHQDDLIGRLLSHQPDEWERLRLPALAEADDPLGRPEGAALWPWRFSVEALEQIRATQSDYSWSALYQQRPTPAEGGIFKRGAFNVVPAFGEQAQVVRYWDLAMSSKTSADYTASVKLAVGHDGRTKVMDARRQRLEWGEVVRYIADTALEDGPLVMIGIEEQGFMSRAVQELLADPRLHHFTIYGYPAEKDKLTRALPFAARVAAGQVDVFENYWSWDWIDELCSFPNGSHDDWVDAASGAWAMLGQSTIPLGGVVYDSTPGALVGAY